MTLCSILDALIHNLSTRLTSGATATETLLAWCEEHGLSHGPITANVRQRFSPSVLPDTVLTALEPAPGTTVHYRQVQLMRGTLRLATAENWFVPQRLTAAMNDRLHMTDLPFGTVVAPLCPSRRTLVAHVRPRSADPSEDPPQLHASAHHPQPEIILEHQAVIFSESGTALALVKEKFCVELVSFAASKHRFEPRSQGELASRTSDAAWGLSNDNPS